ncbi:hypothetical protein [Geobacter sp. FeAm09]|uniref:hypothetical protein n=1 Tax=Geobacter sp. FeAm09 TaxID=2597769 RepID=UPI00197AA316|nr:hypothetical protein [Geobacter sp. FeAm09]
MFKQSGLFKEVNLVEKLERKPNLIAELEAVSNRPMCATGEASLMIMTLGIVPLSNDDQTYSFRIRSTKSSDGLPIGFTYIQKSYFGSLINLLNLSSNWSRTPQGHRNIDLLAFELVSRKEDVLRLVVSDTP